MELRKCRRRIAIAIVVLLLCISFAPVTAIAQEPWRAGAKPTFLVATRNLTDPLFEQTVVLMLPPPTSLPLVVGLIINKPTAIPLQKLFPAAPALKRHTETAFFGGPVELTAPSLLLRGSQQTGEDVLPLIEDISVTIDPASVAGLLKDPKPARDLRVFLGRAQWTPNQLHAEILEGSWYVVPVEAKLVFSADPASMWRTLVGHAELQEVNAPPGGDEFTLLQFAQTLW
jgi:putative transcriptional regulator